MPGKNKAKSAGKKSKKKTAKKKKPKICDVC